MNKFCPELTSTILKFYLQSLVYDGWATSAVWKMLEQQRWFCLVNSNMVCALLGDQNWDSKITVNSYWKELICLIGMLFAKNRSLWRSKIKAVCESLNVLRMERYQRKKERRKRKNFYFYFFSFPKWICCHIFYATLCSLIELRLLLLLFKQFKHWFLERIFNYISKFELKHF